MLKVHEQTIPYRQDIRMSDIIAACKQDIVHSAREGLIFLGLGLP